MNLGRKKTIERMNAAMDEIFEDVNNGKNTHVFTHYLGLMFSGEVDSTNVFIASKMIGHSVGLTANSISKGLVERGFDINPRRVATYIKGYYHRDTISRKEGDYMEYYRADL